MIYLDNAATTYPKPIGVAASLMKTLVDPFGNAGRGGHSAAMRAADCVYEARRALSDLFGLSDERRVVFSKNATESLNIALFGLLSKQRDARVVTSTLEHNSVLRPLYELARRGCIRLDFFEPSAEDEVSFKRFVRAMENGAYLVAVSACANTTGQRLPIRRICEYAHSRGALTVVDAAQAAGSVDLSMADVNADYLCFPAHKGLYGIMGLGALLIAEHAPCPDPVLFGGAGVDSAALEMPTELPERLEAGTVNAHAAAALLGGVDYLRLHGIDSLRKKEEELALALREGLIELGARVFSPEKSSIVLFNVDSVAPEELAARLDEAGICVRAGLHCAPLAHRSLGTFPLGAVRASFGAFNTASEVEETLACLRKIR